VNKLTPDDVKLFLFENQLDFQSTHRKVCFPILHRIYDKLMMGYRFDPIKTEGTVIIDGHHRYICMKLLELDIETVPWTKSFSTEITLWQNVEVVVADWETADQIEWHNKVWQKSENDLSL
jgi:hypothetical protein